MGIKPEYNHQSRTNIPRCSAAEFLIAEDENIDIKTAMKKWYTSKFFDKLQDSETGLYRESGSYVYELYKDDSSL